MDYFSQGNNYVLLIIVLLIFTAVLLFFKEIHFFLFKKFKSHEDIHES